MKILKGKLHGSTTDAHVLRGFLLSLVVCCWLLDGHGRLALAVLFSLRGCQQQAAIVHTRGNQNDIRLDAHKPTKRPQSRRHCISRFSLGHAQW
ncbi:hypothetical protein F5Y08DRAFT_307796 [Xylaria arbuscula]|nr:hypothetical protein F5Y08DRAFT_307796 [Xylaria arbuscula]